MVILIEGGWKSKQEWVQEKIGGEALERVSIIEILPGIVLWREAEQWGRSQIGK